VPLLRETLTYRQGEGAAIYVEVLGSLARCLLRQEKWAEVEPVARAYLAIREREAGDDWTTFDVKAMLGGALLGQGKYDEARPLLVDGFEGMKQRSGGGIMHPYGKARLVDTLDRLIALAEATDQPDQAHAWRDQKAKMTAPPDPAPKPGAGKP